MDKGTATKTSGVYRIDSETYVVRMRKMDPATGLMREKQLKVTTAQAREAGHTGPLEKFAIKVRLSLDSDFDLSAPVAGRTRFSDWAEEVYTTRQALGKVRAAETKAKWRGVLDNHLLKKWGDTFVDAITRVEVQKWLTKMGEGMQAHEMTPSTMQTRWSIFKTIMTRAAVHFDIKDPTLLVELPVDDEYSTYTDEEPNSLLPSELPAFFDAAWQYERQHFAMLVIGTLTGRRACELRPLRRQGPLSDLDWETGQLRIRRSQTKGDAANVLKQKNKKPVQIFLPPMLLDVLRTHVANLTPYRKTSDLLFPRYRPFLDGAGAPNVGYMSKSALDRPLRNICEKAGIKKHITAKGAMRRTYQDLCRAAEVNRTIQMAMSGHATEAMLELYSSATADEKRSALAKMSDIAGLAKAARLA